MVNSTQIKGRFAVIGYPVDHSMSPQIHHQFAAQFKSKIEYTRLLAQPNGLPAVLKKFAEEDGQGANITLPFKQEACALCIELSPAARTAKAVNTICFSEGWYGDNTDGAGLVNDLSRNLGIRLSGLRVLVIGAGGATRGILGPLLAQKSQEIIIANRTLNKAIDLSEDFSDQGKISPTDLRSLTEASNHPFDLIIQASSAGHQGGLPPLSKTLCHPDTFCYDLSYGKAAEGFLNWSKGATAAHLVADGMGMLVEQAALSFTLWFGKQPATAKVIATIRNATGHRMNSSE